MEDVIINSLNDGCRVLDAFIHTGAITSISKVAIMMAEALREGKKIISCGNGGSLCDATHFAEELTGRYRKDRKPYPAIAINDPAYITCVGNDYSFDEIFSRYVEGVGKAGDILFAISTSGNSPNVVKAAEAAKLKDMHVISLTGTQTNHLSRHSDISIQVPSIGFSDRVQEIHIKIIHILIQVIEHLLEYQ